MFYYYFRDRTQPYELLGVYNGFSFRSTCHFVRALIVFITDRRLYISSAMELNGNAQTHNVFLRVDSPSPDPDVVHSWRDSGGNSIKTARDVLRSVVVNNTEANANIERSTGEQRHSVTWTITNPCVLIPVNPPLRLRKLLGSYLVEVTDKIETIPNYSNIALAEMVDISGFSQRTRTL